MTTTRLPRFTDAELDALASACGFILAGDAAECFGGDADAERTAAALERAHGKLDVLRDARASRAPRFTRPERGVLRVAIDGVTYTATYYRSGGAGTRPYWTIQTDDRDYTDGNDWYEPNERRVREAIVAVAAKRRAASERTA